MDMFTAEEVGMQVEEIPQFDDMMSIKQKILSLVPKTCPICGAPTKLSDDLMHLVCTNDQCGGKLFRRIEIMAKAFGIDNIGIKVAQELVDCLDLQNEAQIFDLSVQDFLKVPRYQEGMATKLYDSIHSVELKKIPWSDFIRGCQIFRIGEGTAKDMAAVYHSTQELFDTTPEEMARKMKSMTVNLTSQVVKSIQERKEVIKALESKVQISYDDVAPVTDKGDFILAVVTGKLGFGSRPEFQKTFGDTYKVKWGTAVSSNTDILVTNEVSTSSKYKAATKLQEQGGKIKIMTEEEFIEYIGGSGNTASNRMEETHKQVQELDMFGGVGADL